jgi:hypothetical protein
MRASILSIALAATVAACGDDSPAVDANTGPVVDASIDAPQVECTARTFVPGATIGAGADDDLYGIGPGAWVANAEDQAAPGAILYLEVYRELFAGDVVEVDGFRNWISECEACVFFGTGCDPYDIPIGDTGTPAAPTHCDALFMIERGVVDFASLDVDPSSGSLAGEIVPLTGEASVRFVQVYREGDPSSPTGYGMMIPGGECLEVDGVQFDGTWLAQVDAGVPDAGMTDANPTDAGVAAPDGAP